MATQTVKQSLLRIANTWPKDKIRPNHQFSDAVSKIAESHPAWSAAGNSHEIKDGEALVGALDRLLQNRAIRQFPMRETTKRPPSMPKHYANLVDGLQKAERGEREAWWKSLLRFRK